MHHLSLGNLGRRYPDTRQGSWEAPIFRINMSQGRATTTIIRRTGMLRIRGKCAHTRFISFVYKISKSIQNSIQFLNKPGGIIKLRAIICLRSFRFCCHQLYLSRVVKCPMFQKRFSVVKIINKLGSYCQNSKPNYYKFRYENDINRMNWPPAPMHKAGLFVDEVCGLAH